MNFQETYLMELRQHVVEVTQGFLQWNISIQTIVDYFKVSILQLMMSKSAIKILWDPTLHGSPLSNLRAPIPHYREGHISYCSSYPTVPWDRWDLTCESYLSHI